MPAFYRASSGSVMGNVVDKVTVRQVYLLVFRSSLSVSLYQCSIIIFILILLLTKGKALLEYRESLGKKYFDIVFVTQRVSPSKFLYTRVIYIVKRSHGVIYRT